MYPVGSADRGQVVLIHPQHQLAPYAPAVRIDEHPVPGGIMGHSRQPVRPFGAAQEAGIEPLGAALRQTLGFLVGGAQLFVANPDESHPGADGAPVPETGSLLAAILSVLPDLPYTIIGKPERGLYHAALQRLPGDVRRILAIDDNPRTDAVGAARLGLDCALIGASHGDWLDLQHLVDEGAGVNVSMQRPSA